MTHNFSKVTSCDKKSGCESRLIYLFKLLLAAILTIVISLIVLRIFVDLFSVVLSHPLRGISLEEAKALLSEILLVFILIELLRTVYIYVAHQDVYINALFEAAIVAILRRIILIEIEDFNPAYIISMTILISALVWIYMRLSSSEKSKKNIAKNRDE